MIKLVNSYCNPFSLENLAEEEESTYTLVDHSLNGKKYYYRKENSVLSLGERIYKLVLALFQTLATLGLGLIFSSRVRSHWREALWNQREMIILSTRSCKEISFSKHVNQKELQNFIAFLNHLFMLVSKDASLGDDHFNDRQSLNFSNNQLTNLPEIIGHFNDFQCLYLSHNRLTDLPESIGQLTHLQELYLENNQLTDLPESIGQLTHLQSLNLSNNRLTNLPESMRQLTHLQGLYFSHNQLTNLPENMGQLTHLQELYLSDNQLTNLPENMGQLTHLQKLHLSHNQLTNLSESIGQLTNLYSLALSNNQLTYLPEGIGQLTNLKYLYLGDNQLTNLPESMGQLTHLQYLDLGDNHLQAIPSCLYQLPSNCEVYLENNRFSEQDIADIQSRVNVPDYTGPQFIFSVHREDSTIDNLQELKDILPEWCEEEASRQTLLMHLSLEQQNNLTHWLLRLKGTADYKKQMADIKKKVSDLLTWLAKKSEAKQTEFTDFAHQIFKDATETCGDRLTLSVNTLSLHVKVCQSSTLDLKGLKELVIGLERYEMLQNIARQKCQTLKGVDPIEVYLCYEVELKEELDLPASNMLYKTISQVTKDDIASAKTQIFSQTSSQEHQMKILMQSPIWKAALETQDHFKAIKQNCDFLKEEALNQLDMADMASLQNYENEFKQNDQTIWNPIYIMTQSLIESNADFS